MDKFTIPQELLKFETGMPDDLWFGNANDREPFEMWVAKQLGVEKPDDVVFVLYTCELTGAAERFMYEMQQFADGKVRDMRGATVDPETFDGQAIYIYGEDENGGGNGAAYEVAELSTIPGCGVIFEYSDGGFGVYFARNQ
ncbi:hypothetical protein CPT_MyoSmar_101 [Serratia phage MyoSmar]|uniref:Uncharacterized protein n=1 Tax=Serratia phage MyoSmar TaxID=2596673 RepID=A0A5B9NC15_9CAUD|nr:hypothetical protein HWC56_gp101 [Serratia phage MyoSmar]QEG09550.1 hypothetical protein CPT_MyoSmar_101 [Serratia phage MyoSmar]